MVVGYNVNHLHSEFSEQGIMAEKKKKRHNTYSVISKRLGQIESMTLHYNTA